MKNLKPIQWKQPVPFIDSWWGDTPLGRYYIWHHHGWYTCEYKYQKLKSCRSLADARACCSAHYADTVASLFDDADTAKGTP